MRAAAASGGGAQGEANALLPRSERGSSSSLVFFTFTADQRALASISFPDDRPPTAQPWSVVVFIRTLQWLRPPSFELAGSHPG